METLKEFDWCLDQLDSLRASMSISEMASNKVRCFIMQLTNHTGLAQKFWFLTEKLWCSSCRLSCIQRCNLI